MSWIDRLEGSELEITTGDGEIYKPLWQNAIKNVRYNTEGFDFVGIEGTYVERTEQSGDQFPITFYFTGENCVDIANNFQISSKDPRPWKLRHPFFDDIDVQPLNLQFDYSDYNIVKITGVLWKTINQKYPEDRVNVSDQIVVIKEAVDDRVLIFTEAAILDPNVGLITPLTDLVNAIGDAFAFLARTIEEVKALKDFVRAVSGSIQNIFNDLTSFVEDFKNLINFPFTIIADIESSFNAFTSSFDNIVELFDSEDDQQSVMQEISFSLLISAASALYINPGEGEYITRESVAQTSEYLTDLYNSVNEYLDGLNYVQDSDLALLLDNIITSTAANLYEIAFNAQQERSFYLSKNDNIINLAHQYFGRGDEKLEEFINTNNITLDEHLQVKKGRLITYYV